jgi:putative transposase
MGKSRKDWMLRVFKEKGENNSRNKEYQFWRQSLSQTIIHNNAVEAGIVDKPEHYLYSSAKDYHYGKRTIRDRVLVKNYP